jgi:hypothetical protein
MRIAAAIAVLLAASAAETMAGGISYDVRVVAFTKGKKPKASFVLEGAKEELMPGCRSVHVAAEYDVSRWPWDTERTFTRSAHSEAIDRLKTSFASGTAMRFGLMGTGLGQDSEARPCVFRSRGLAILEEEPGIQAVNSVYKHP